MKIYINKIWFLKNNYLSLSKQFKINMKTFSNIVKNRSGKMLDSTVGQERKWILQSLVNITLNYKLSGNMGMYYHSLK